MTVLSQYLYGHPVWLSLSSGGHASTEVRAQALRVQPRHGQRCQPPATSSQPASHLPHHAARHYEQRGCDAASQSGCFAFSFTCVLYQFVGGVVIQRVSLAVYNFLLQSLFFTRSLYQFVCGVVIAYRESVWLFIIFFFGHFS